METVTRPNPGTKPEVYSWEFVRNERLPVRALDFQIAFRNEVVGPVLEALAHRNVSDDHRRRMLAVLAKTDTELQFLLFSLVLGDGGAGPDAPPSTVDLTVADDWYTPQTRADLGLSEEGDNGITRLREVGGLDRAATHPTAAESESAVTAE